MISMVQGRKTSRLLDTSQIYSVVNLASLYRYMSVEPPRHLRMGRCHTVPAEKWWLTSLSAELIQSQRRRSLDLLEILGWKVGCGGHDAFYAHRWSNCIRHPFVISFAHESESGTSATVTACLIGRPCCSC